MNLLRLTALNVVFYDVYIIVYDVPPEMRKKENLWAIGFFTLETS